MNNEQDVVIVTGSGGLIGSALVERLADQVTVVGFDRDVPSEPMVADFATVDVTSDQSVQQGLGHVRERHGERIASVIHLAAYYDFSGEPSPLYDEVTVSGTARLLRELQAF